MPHGLWSVSFFQGVNQPSSFLTEKPFPFPSGHWARHRPQSLPFAASCGFSPSPSPSVHGEAYAFTAPWRSCQATDPTSLVGLGIWWPRRWEVPPSLASEVQKGRQGGRTKVQPAPVQCEPFEDSNGSSLGNADENQQRGPRIMMFGLFAPDIGFDVWC